jgi:nucleotide-binding universal stress UspA family protein
VLAEENAMMPGSDHRADARRAALRVLIAVHGHEMPGWGAATARAVSCWESPVVRVLSVLDVPSPPRTSPIALARREYQAARAAWQRQEEQRLQAPLDALLPMLPRGVEVLRVPAAGADPVRTIARHVAEWAPDVVVIGAVPRTLRAWLWPGAIHERLVRRLTCAVLITPPPAPATSRPARVGRIAPPAAAHRRA